MAVLPFFKSKRFEDSDSFINDLKKDTTTSQSHTSETSEDAPHFSRVPSIKKPRPYPTMSAANVSQCANATNTSPVTPLTTNQRPEMPIMPFTKPLSTDSLPGRSDSVSILSALLEKRASVGTERLDMPILPLTSTPPIPTITPLAAQIRAAGTDVSSRFSFPLSPPPQTTTSNSFVVDTPTGTVLAPWCREVVLELATPTASPIPILPGQSITMKYVMTTECYPHEDSITTKPSKISTVYMKGSPITMSEGVTLTSKGTTFVTATVTATAALSAISLPATTPSAESSVIAPPAPGKHGLSKASIGLISTASVLSLIVLVVLAYFLLRYIRKRKEAQHGKLSFFWRKLFAPTHPAERAIPLAEIPRTRPSPFRTSMSTNPYRAPDLGLMVAAAPPKRNFPFDSIKAAVKSRADQTYSHQFPTFTSTYAERQAARERARSGYPDSFSTNTDPDDVGHGLGASKGPFDMLEICLDENVALEEEEKAELLRQQEKASWDAPRRSMSPFPTNPFSKVTRPPQHGVRTLM